MFTLKIELENASLRSEDGESVDTQTVADLIEVVGRQVRDYQPFGTVRDGNGNTVGTWSITDDGKVL